MPRTDTSDNVTTPSQLFFRLVADQGILVNQILYVNNQASVSVVVTTMDVCNVSGTSGDVVCIGLGGPNLPAAMGLFGAQTGAGSFDTFSWRGQLVLNPNDTLIVFSVTGTWSFSATGFKQPAVQ